MATHLEHEPFYPPPAMPTKIELHVSGGDCLQEFLKTVDVRLKKLEEEIRIHFEFNLDVDYVEVVVVTLPAQPEPEPEPQQLHQPSGYREPFHLGQAQRPINLSTYPPPRRSCQSPDLDLTNACTTTQMHHRLLHIDPDESLGTCTEGSSLLDLAALVAVGAVSTLIIKDSAQMLNPATRQLIQGILQTGCRTVFDKVLLQLVARLIDV